MASLGQELKRERELRAVSLHDIVRQTKIGLSHLQALENDRLDLLPGVFFIKGMIRAYAQCLGVESERYVNKYHEEVLLQEDAREKDRKRRETVLDVNTPRKPRAGWRALAAIAVIVLAAGGGFLMFKPRPVAPRVEIPTTSTSLPVSEPLIPAVIPPAPEAAISGIRLELSFIERTWIHAAGDGRVVLEGNYDAGSKAVCEASREIVIQCGNAGGIELMINGRPAKPLGASGQVLTDLRINRDNWTGFLK